ncbi:unnamed protein product, partial [Effrenium voratum]
HDRAMAMLRNSVDEKYNGDMSQLVARHTHELITAQAQSTQAIQQKEAEFQDASATWEAHCKRLQQRVETLLGDLEALLKSKQNEKVAMEAKISTLQAAMLKMEAELKEKQQQDPGMKKAEQRAASSKFKAKAHAGGRDAQHQTLD